VSLLDLVLVAIVGGSVVSGFLTGFARAAVGFAATVTGILFGFWFYGIPAAWIRGYVSSPTFSNVAGFLVVFFAFALLGALIGKVLSKLFKWTGLSWLDRIMGAGFGLVRGGVAAAAFVEGNNQNNCCLDGGPDADLIVGYDGDDSLDGHGNGDQLYGGADDDHLYGGDGVDYLAPQNGTDIVYGEGGNDTLIGEGGGQDVLDCGGGYDKFTRGPGDAVADNCENNVS